VQRSLTFRFKDKELTDRSEKKKKLKTTDVEAEMIHLYRRFLKCIGIALHGYKNNFINKSD
jgi:hypothetical protein